VTDLPEPAGDFGWTAGLGPVRESFEAWASAQGWAPSDLSDKCMPGSPRGCEYRHQGAQEMWETWEAATGIARRGYWRWLTSMVSGDAHRAASARPRVMRLMEKAMDISKLEGGELDHAVGRALGIPVELSSAVSGVVHCYLPGETKPADWPSTPYLRSEIRRDFFGRVKIDSLKAIGHLYAPSTDWAFGGPIIERERITLHPSSDGLGAWISAPGRPDFWGNGVTTGTTPLIAAMRAFVVSKTHNVEVEPHLSARTGVEK